MKAGPIELWEIFDYVLYDADYVLEDGITVNKYMKLWTEQPGYPLITVKSASDGSFVASQVMQNLKSKKNHTVFVS